MAEQQDFFSGVLGPRMSLASLSEAINADISTQKLAADLRREQMAIARQMYTEGRSDQIDALKARAEDRMAGTAAASEQRGEQNDAYRSQKDRIDIARGLTNDAYNRRERQWTEMRQHAETLREMYGQYNSLIAPPVESDADRNLRVARDQMKSFLDSYIGNNSIASLSPGTPDFQKSMVDKLEAGAPALKTLYLQSPMLQEWTRRYVDAWSTQGSGPTAVTPGTKNPYTEVDDWFTAQVAPKAPRQEEVANSQQMIMRYLSQAAPYLDTSDLQAIGGQLGLLAPQGGHPQEGEDPYQVAHTPDGGLGVYHRQHGRVRLGTIGKEEVWVSSEAVGGTFEGSRGKIVMPRRTGSPEDRAAIEKFNAAPNRRITLDTPVAIIGKQAEEILRSRRKGGEGPPTDLKGADQEGAPRAERNVLLLGDILGWPTWDPGKRGPQIGRRPGEVPTVPGTPPDMPGSTPLPTPEPSGGVSPGGASVPAPGAPVAGGAATPEDLIMRPPSQMGWGVDDDLQAVALAQQVLGEPTLDGKSLRDAFNDLMGTFEQPASLDLPARLALFRELAYGNSDLSNGRAAQFQQWLESSGISPDQFWRGVYLIYQYQLKEK